MNLLIVQMVDHVQITTLQDCCPYRQKIHGYITSKSATNHFCLMLTPQSWAICYRITGPLAWGCTDTLTGARNVHLMRSKRSTCKVIQNNIVMVELKISIHFQQFQDLKFQKFSGIACSWTPPKAFSYKCLRHLHDLSS